MNNSREFKTDFDQLIRSVKERRADQVVYNLQNIGIGLDGMATALSGLVKTADNLSKRIEKLEGAAGGLQAQGRAASSSNIFGYSQATAGAATPDPTDSGSYEMTAGVFGVGQDILPGYAIRSENNVLYAAHCRDTANRMDGVYIKTDGSGNFLYRSGGTTQCSGIGTPIEGQTVYLSTIDGKLTCDPTETTGGARAFTQPVGKLQKVVRTSIGGSLWVVALQLQEPQNS